MNDNASAESSVLLWTVAGCLAALALRVALGWLRRVQHEPDVRKSWRAWLLAALALGTGLCCAAVLSLAAEAVPFAMGFRIWTVPALWLGTVAACLPLLWWLARNQRWWSLLGSGLLLAALVGAVQFGWLQAVGFRPGLRWQLHIVAASALTLAAVCWIALWMALSTTTAHGDRRWAWRLGASLLFGFGFVVANSILTLAGGLEAQKGSIYHDQVPLTIVGMVCGVLLPLVLMMMAVDLAMRRRDLRRSSGSRKRRRRRQHVRRI